MTVGAGARYGLLFPLGLAAPLGLVPAERWLFFAEARHSVTLYYGQREV